MLVQVTAEAAPLYRCDCCSSVVSCCHVCAAAEIKRKPAANVVSKIRGAVYEHSVPQGTSWLYDTFA